MPNSSNDITKEGATVLAFVKLYKDNNFGDHSFLLIYWKNPLNMNITNSYFEKYHNYDWTDEIEEHYKNGIIDDIDIL